MNNAGYYEKMISDIARCEAKAEPEHKDVLKEVINMLETKKDEIKNNEWNEWETWPDIERYEIMKCVKEKKEGEYGRVFSISKYIEFKKDWMQYLLERFNETMDKDEEVEKNIVEMIEKLFKMEPPYGENVD